MRAITGLVPTIKLATSGQIKHLVSEGDSTLQKILKLAGSWSNHFEPDDSNTASANAGLLGFPQGKVRAHLWEAEFTYNFGQHHRYGHQTRTVWLEHSFTRHAGEAMWVSILSG